MQNIFSLNLMAVISSQSPELSRTKLLSKSVEISAFALVLYPR